ncbi:hypothetical protein G7085_12310 [Tessaracoccus sp. HDW20]|nr:hypothetical protein [Tessaracoccus coleopterorum]
MRDSSRVAQAIQELGARGYWVRSNSSGTPIESLSRDHILELLESADAIVTIYAPRDIGGSGWIVGSEYGCSVEVWRSEHEAGVEYMIGPRENRASRQLAMEDFQLQPTSWNGVPSRTPKALTRRMLDDIDFPIDAVYTWVDGADPEWLTRRGAAAAREAGSPIIQRLRWRLGSPVGMSSSTLFGLSTTLPRGSVESTLSPTVRCPTGSIC